MYLSADDAELIIIVTPGLGAKVISDTGYVTYALFMAINPLSRTILPPGQMIPN